MDSTRSQHLAFLLSLGTIPLACTDGDDGSGSDSTATTTATTTDATTTDATATTTTTDATTSGSATMGETAGTTDATGTTGTTTGGLEGACESYWMKQAECYPRYYTDVSGYINDCMATLAGLGQVFGPACADAYSAYLECVGGLSCDALMEPMNACEALSMTQGEACVVVPGSTCLAFAEKIAMCDPRTDVDEAAEFCQFEISAGTLEYGEACGKVTEERYACLSELSCAEFEGPNVCDEIDLSPCDAMP